MKVNIEIDLPEADIIWRALKVIDPSNIFTALLKEKIATAAKPAVDAQKEQGNDKE